MSEWWQGLRPYQRETTWTAVFGLTGLAVFAAAVFVVWLLDPETLSAPGSVVAASAVGAGWSLFVSLGGMLLGFRLEDRHADKLRERGEKYRV